MPEFYPQQCWISDAELNLGVGVIESVEQRRLKVYYAAVDEYRVYATHSAPLSRLVFSVGDSIKNRAGDPGIITQIELRQHCYYYRVEDSNGQSAELFEADIYPVIQLNQPLSRLFNQQIDKNQSFKARYLSRQYQNYLFRHQQQLLFHFKTSLIPHQLYVAQQVAARHAPRVLLADEVGLGKTIEAGMILSYQLLTEKISRVLIIVPESLLHQWLVEMLRRFNVHLSIFDSSRCREEESSGSSDNPFDNAQLVLSSIEFITDQTQRFEQMCAAGWDMLIVDEAHHLHWDQQTQGSAAYRCIETLSQQIASVLLLTATPEQLGKQSHFARLRLLDGDRFNDYQQFLRQEQSYQQLANWIEQLRQGGRLSHSDIENINALTDEQFNADEVFSDRHQQQALINLLLDSHGTGRVLFRNTRASIQGFPERRHYAYALAYPQQYQNKRDSAATEESFDGQKLLSPESLLINDSEDWTIFDSRVAWLIDFLARYQHEKILLICAYAASARQLQQYVQLKKGIECRVFDEQMSLVERDRAAAYFADLESRCRLLICSEIGSEGRNFQFSHHLVLFDLPFNPDLLEQRIGRLDRIGQTRDIHIHIPYFVNSVQQLMYQWYHQSLNAFEQTNSIAYQIFSQYYDTLMQFIIQQDRIQDVSALSVSHTSWSAFIARCRTDYEHKIERVHQGRDRLIEYNSFRSDEAEKIMKSELLFNKNNNIDDYIEVICDVLGVSFQLESSGKIILHPGEKMYSRLNFLADDGISGSSVRSTVLADDNLHFFSLSHPLIQEMTDQIISSEQGNTAVVSLSHPQYPPGTLLLQALYLIDTGLNSLNEMISVMVDNQGRLQDNLTPSIEQCIMEDVKPQITTQLMQTYKALIQQMHDAAYGHAQKRALPLIERLFTRNTTQLLQEKQRLVHLQKVNHLIRDEEINHLEQKILEMTQAKDKASVNLDAVRLMICL